MDADELDWNRTLREQWSSTGTISSEPGSTASPTTNTSGRRCRTPGAYGRAAARRRPCRSVPGTSRSTTPFPSRSPRPFTTIAWRLGHVIVGVLAARNAAHFGAPAASYETWEYAGSAATALDQLETQLDVWLAGVRGLGEAGLRVPVGAKEPYPEASMADLVLHIHRELIHHLSEVCLLRDLYPHTESATDGATR